MPAPTVVEADRFGRVLAGWAFAADDRRLRGQQEAGTDPSDGADDP